MEITGDYERVWEVCALPGSVRREFDEICFYHIESSGMGDYNDDSVFPGVLNSGDSSHGFLYGGHTGSYWFVVYRETGKSKNKTLFFKVHKNDEVSVWQYGAKPDGQTFDELIENLKAGDKKFTKILRMAEMEYEW
ncbi:MAG: hypothetical protein JW860_16435 [Sedimentisphaerales bacterium]|nr:hypothetical protein [Sedimentisphaerales bacterium]